MNIALQTLGYAALIALAFVWLVFWAAMMGISSNNALDHDRPVWQKAAYWLAAFGSLVLFLTPVGYGCIEANKPKPEQQQAESTK